VHADQQPSGSWSFILTQDEAVVLQEALGRAEWADDLDSISLDHPAETEVFTRLMLALRAAVPSLGTVHYEETVVQARAAVLEQP
jgi:hypothetical protein